MTQHQEANSAEPAEICGTGATVPADFPVQPIDPDDPAAIDPATCGNCGLTWDDGIPTTWTPAPSGRCPFEYFHDEPEEQDTPDESDDYIADDRDGYSVTHDERNIGTYPTLRRAEACLYLARARSNYWPNIWRVNDHGNITLCVFDSHVLRATDIGYV